MTEAPIPCQGCTVLRKHDCKLQAVCAKVKRWNRKVYEAALTEHEVKSKLKTIRRQRRR